MQTVKNIFEFLGSRGNLEKLIESWGEVRKKHEDVIIESTFHFNDQENLHLYLEHELDLVYEVFALEFVKFSKASKVKFNCTIFDSNELAGDFSVVTYNYNDEKLKHFGFTDAVKLKMKVKNTGYTYLPTETNFESFESLLLFVAEEQYGAASFDLNNSNSSNQESKEVKAYQSLDTGMHLFLLTNGAEIVIDSSDFETSRNTFTMDEALDSVKDVFEYQWRLPSLQELKWMSEHLFEKGKGDFVKKPYWSAEFKSTDGGYTFVFGSGIEPEPRSAKCKLRLVLDVDKTVKSHLSKELKNKKQKSVKITSKKALVTLNPNEIKVGRKTWNTQNLNTDAFRNGDKIAEAKSSEEWIALNNNKKPAWCYYDFDSSNGEKFGKLYNWYAVKDPKGIAPEGWRVADTKDLMQLMKNNGGELEAGLKLKYTEGWEKEGSGTNGTNDIGFNAHPAGSINERGDFVKNRKEANFWSSTLYHPVYAQFFYLWGSNNQFVKSATVFDKGFSVRCVKE